MLYDRDYMRRPPNPQTVPNLSALSWLLILLVTFFVLQNVLEIAFGVDGMLGTRRGFLSSWFALTHEGVRSFRVWTFLTYGFFHGSFFHILLNGLVLFFVGRIIESLQGEKTFLRVFLFSVVAGGLFWTLLNAIDGWSAGGVQLIGASAGVFGLIFFFCLQRPHEPTTFLLFFVIPVRIKPIWLVYGLTAYSLFSIVFSEFAWAGRGGVSTNIAHSAHLGGGLGGILMAWLYATGKLWHDPNWRLQVWVRSFFTERKRGSRKAPRAGYSINLGAEDAGPSQNEPISPSEASKAEIDRILDKINAKGFGSLTSREKELLHRARDILRK